MLETLSVKKSRVIIHLMAFRVIVPVAFKWILFQMLAGSETSRGITQMCCFSVVSHVSAVVYVRQFVLSVSVRGLCWSTDIRMASVSLRGNVLSLFLQRHLIYHVLQQGSL